MNASVRRIWPLLTAAVVLGCDSWDRDVPGFVVRDSAGIAIAESLKPAWMAGEGWQISTEPILDVGQMAGEEVFLFNRIRDVTRSGTGNVVVANGAPQEIRIFDSSGTFLRSIGRGGDGPDEFGRLAAVQARAADTVVALDLRRPRILAFGLIGNLLWSSTLATGTGSSMGSPASLVDGSFVVGWVANQPEVLTEYRARPGTIFQWMVALVRHTPGGLADTIGVFAGADGVWVETPEVREIMVTPPLGRRELGFSAHGAQVYVGTGDGYQIAVYGPGEIPERIIRRGNLDLSISQAGVDSVWNRRLADLEDPQARREMGALSSATPYPEQRAPYGDIVVDSDGSLWVAKYRSDPDPPSHFDVFDPDGRWLGEMTLPEGFQVFEIGKDYALGVYRDELGIEHVRMYGLVK